MAGLQRRVALASPDKTHGPGVPFLPEEDGGTGQKARWELLQREANRERVWDGDAQEQYPRQTLPDQVGTVRGEGGEAGQGAPVFTTSSVKLFNSFDSMSCKFF